MRHLRKGLGSIGEYVGSYRRNVQEEILRNDLTVGIINYG